MSVHMSVHVFIPMSADARICILFAIGGVINRYAKAEAAAKSQGFCKAAKCKDAELTAWAAHAEKIERQAQAMVKQAGGCKGAKCTEAELKKWAQAYAKTEGKKQELPKPQHPAE